MLPIRSQVFCPGQSNSKCGIRENYRSDGGGADVHDKVYDSSSRLTHGNQLPLGFPWVGGDPGCEWCVGLGRAIVPDNTLRGSFSRAQTTHPRLLQLTRWVSIG